MTFEVVAVMGVASVVEAKVRFENWSNSSLVEMVSLRWIATFEEVVVVGVGSVVEANV